MKYYFDTPLTYDERLELIPALSDVARMYYDEPDTKINLFAGICYQLVHFANVKSAYSKMARLMVEIGYSGEDSYFEGQSPTSFTSYDDWEQRAYMCLFLSEYLWDTLQDYVTDIQIDETESKSLWQKAKDKFNNFVQHLKDFHEARTKMEAAARVSV